LFCVPSPRSPEPEPIAPSPHSLHPTALAGTACASETPGWHSPMRLRDPCYRCIRLQRLFDDLPLLLMRTPSSLRFPLNDGSFRTVHLFSKWTLPEVPTKGHLPQLPTLRQYVTDRTLTLKADSNAYRFVRGDGIQMISTRMLLCPRPQLLVVRWWPLVRHKSCHLQGWPMEQ